MRIITYKTKETNMKMKHLREKIREQILIVEGARLTKYDRKALSFISKLPPGIKLQCPRIESINSARDLLDWNLANGDGFVWVDEKGKDYKPFYKVGQVFFSLASLSFVHFVLARALAVLFRLVWCSEHSKIMLANTMPVDTQ